MPRRSEKSATKRSAKRQALFGCVTLAILTYFSLVGHMISSHLAPSSKTEVIPSEVIMVSSKPPLETLVQGWNVTGNVSWLMDFSIVGFPKTGTSTLMFYLEQYTDSIFIFPDERCELGWNQHVKLIRAMYRQYQPQRRMGIKCPRDLEIDLSLSNYNQFFPSTKFIIGLRHPVIWFQSFYNFRVANEFPMPPAEKLIGKCARPNQGVCTHRANFSNHMQRIEPWRKVFLYHVDQLQDNSSQNNNNGPLFRQDLGSFLELTRPLTKPMIWVKPGQRTVTAEKQKEIDALKMDICQDRYAQLRRVLLTQGTQSAAWIHNVFMKQSNVVVSNPEQFSKLLAAWQSDPCSYR